MFFKQYYLGCLSHASYLIADEEEGLAAVVDPQRDIDQYLEEAAGLGVSIRFVFLTHLHADFVAGHLELQQRCGARIYLGHRAQADYDHVPMRDGESVRLGKVRFHFLETPGHTPEGISILVFDEKRNTQQPHAVLTGDTLFIGDVGRPDLMASVGLSSQELAGMMFDSLRQKLMPLPDETLVYPAHGAGSMCGKNLSPDTFSTMGEQRRSNYALQPMAKDDFVQMVTAHQPQAPAYFSFAADLNRRKRATLQQNLSRVSHVLSEEKIGECMASGCQLLDCRESEEFAAQHLRGSVNVGLEGRFATWAGAVLDRQRPIVVLAPADRGAQAVMRLGRIGFDHVLGYCEDLTALFRAFVDDVEQIARCSPHELAKTLQSDRPPLILDVRQPGEREQVALSDSLHIPLGELEKRRQEVPEDRDLVIHCATGYRSMVAASLLFAHPSSLCDLRGGIEGWQQRFATHPVS